MKIVVLALDGVFDTGLTAVLDTLVTANELAELQQMPSDNRAVKACKRFIG